MFEAFLDIAKILWVLALVYLCYHTFMRGIVAYKMQKVHAREGGREWQKEKYLARQAVIIWFVFTFFLAGLIFQALT
ncbi:MAG: hypothetical protein R3251_00640 [Candidatus Spechtbacterales bacterium]|nr:hypothetical protein [Candidatus Spechtbacterales bacterium]